MIALLATLVLGTPTLYNYEMVDACRAATVEQLEWQDLDITWDNRWSLWYYNDVSDHITIIARGDLPDGRVVWADCEIKDDELKVLDIAPGPL